MSHLFKIYTRRLQCGRREGEEKGDMDVVKALNGGICFATLSGLYDFVITMYSQKPFYLFLPLIHL